jgi:uncharacterized protein (DUF697 family)/predicted GTPase
MPPNLLGRLNNLFSSKHRDQRLQEHLDELRKRTPVPVLWLYGKTQSGKTSIVKYLTGADEAEIGRGFRPCTRFSKLYQFPTEEAPLLTFLDTRGVDEAGYDPAEDLAQFDAQAHLVVVTVKVLDHALENLLANLQTIRKHRPSRPVLLVPTCLHEAYPQQQHPEPFPFLVEPPTKVEAANPLGPWLTEGAAIADDLRRSLEEQARRFAGLADHMTPIDLTQADEGYADPAYGGPAFKETLLTMLPSAYRQTLLALDEANKALKDLYARHALPHIVGYSSLAASAGAIPVPWLDLLILPGIQTRMIYHLAQLYGQPMTGSRFLELAGTLGMGVVARQAVREVVKFIPYVGSIAGAALAGASTFALGKAFCYYYSAVHEGHVPKAEDLKRYYKEQLNLAEQAWGSMRGAAKEAPEKSS